jgi:outer membrane protein OmpA-like peptidoglycan-associated protein
LVTRPDDRGSALLKRKTPQGDFTYIYQQNGGNSDDVGAYALTYVQAGGPPAKKCTVQVYGVNFDTDKSDLTPDSEPVLNQVLAGFRADASYSAEIGGHTDDVGDKAYNRKLSAARANSVRDWLAAHGVDAVRLTSAGCGDSRPLVPNDSDEHRARNRRVELKRTGCKAGG